MKEKNLTCSQSPEVLYMLLWRVYYPGVLAGIKKTKRITEFSQLCLFAKIEKVPPFKTKKILDSTGIEYARIEWVPPLIYAFFGKMLRFTRFFFCKIIAIYAILLAKCRRGLFYFQKKYLFYNH